MYADRVNRRRVSPASLGVAIAINGVLVGALFWANPDLVPAVPRPPLIGEAIELDPLPPPEPAPPPPPEARGQPTQPAPAPMPRPDTSAAPTTIGEPTFTLPPAPPMPFDGGAVGGTGTAPVAEPAPPAPPVMVAPEVDGRYLADFQPPYPPAERRADRDGRVTVRVLIGADGRVKRIERVDATSDAFWTATEAQALKRWRFRPGTRDGVPTEAWRTMTVRFVMED